MLRLETPSALTCGLRIKEDYLPNPWRAGHGTGHLGARVVLRCVWWASGGCLGGQSRYPTGCPWGILPLNRLTAGYSQVHDLDQSRKLGQRTLTVRRWQAGFLHKKPEKSKDNLESFKRKGRPFQNAPFKVNLLTFPTITNEAVIHKAPHAATGHCR